MAAHEVWFEDVEVADELTPLSICPTKEQIRQYSVVCGLQDFGRFTDEEAARKEGLRTIIAPANMIVGFLSRLLTDLARNGILRKLDVNLRAFIPPDDELTCLGIVTEKRIHAGENLVECDVFIENQDGEKVTTGTVTVILPSRG